VENLGTLEVPLSLGILGNIRGNTRENLEKVGTLGVPRCLGKTRENQGKPGTLEVLETVKFPGTRGTLEPLEVLGTVNFAGTQGALEPWNPSCNCGTLETPGWLTLENLGKTRETGKLGKLWRI